MNIDKFGIFLAIVVLVFLGGGTYVASSKMQQIYTEDTHMLATNTEDMMQKTLTVAEVHLHASEDSCYTIIDEKVYDLTDWIAQHPGGKRAILSLCGTDGTAAFMAQHGKNNHAQQDLTSFFIGDLIQ